MGEYCFGHNPRTSTDIEFDFLCDDRDPNPGHLVVCLVVVGCCTSLTYGADVVASFVCVPCVYSNPGIVVLDLRSFSVIDWIDLSSSSS